MINRAVHAGTIEEGGSRRTNASIINQAKSSLADSANIQPRAIRAVRYIAGKEIDSSLH